MTLICQLHDNRMIFGRKDSTDGKLKRRAIALTSSTRKSGQGRRTSVVTASIIRLGNHRDFPIVDAGSEAAWIRWTAYPSSPFF